LARTLNIALLLGLASVIPAGHGQTDDRWWPAQTMPKTIVRIGDQDGPPALRIALQFMVQSVAGLTAKAVNEGRGREMVWVSTGNIDHENWYSGFRAAHPDVQEVRLVEPWELVARFLRQGIIKGYILYRLDQSKGALNTYRAGMDSSVNVATSLAGLLDGLLVDEGLESRARADGLELLVDARDRTQAWCFEAYRDRFSRRLLCTQDPRKPHIRDLAIAHQAFTLYGKDEPISAAMERLEPLSPILGWNGGDEFATTDLSTRYGQIQTATDWCMNLPVLMAGAGDPQARNPHGFSPSGIDWNDRRSAVSFVGTDGDNVQWFQGNFFHGSRSYWDNPDRGKLPYGWSCCFAHLTELCPQAIEYALSTRSSNDSFIEWGAGYFYPDRFGLSRPDRWSLLARQARRTWALMRQTGTRLIGFNFTRWDSAEARKACEVFAGETDGLLAILSFQYVPYEAGAGSTFWVKDRNGLEVPVITARYSIWEHANHRPRSGTPAKIAREIRETVARSFPAGMPRYDWVIAHAWSFFKRSPGIEEDAENMPQPDAAAAGGVRGYSPVSWCAERLGPDIRVVHPEELAWRIRMLHDPAQTKRLMSQLVP
jgi:hypothetical protein